MKIDGNCLVCNSSDVEFKATYRNSHPIYAGMDRVQCKSCGFIFAYPMPPVEKLTEYNARYFDSAHGGQIQKITATAFFSGVARLRVKYITDFLVTRSIKINKILEIGPGPGYFARNWVEKYPETKYYAIETDDTCHNSLKSIGVHLVDVNNNEQVPETMDMVVMAHVLEHISDPQDFLKMTTSNLKKGGVLFIEVPCNDWEHKTFDEPHLLFFDKGPLHYLLNSLGFEQIKVSYHGEEITKLKSKSYLQIKMSALRSKLIQNGVIFPFSFKAKGMEILDSSLERAAVAPFDAHKENELPSWWLRAIAIKK